MAFAENKKFFAGREELVKFVKYIGQFILDNAEDIVGNYRVLTEIEIIGHVSMDSIPSVNVNRKHMVADWNNRRERYKEPSDGDEIHSTEEC